MEGIEVNERYVVTTATGTPVIRTDSAREAARYQHTLKGRIIDRETSEDTITAELVMS